MSGQVAVLVGTKKGAFILTSDAKRQLSMVPLPFSSWNVDPMSWPVAHTGAQSASAKQVTAVSFEHRSFCDGWSVGSHFPTQSAEVVHWMAMSFEQRSTFGSGWPVSQRAQSASVVHAVVTEFVHVLPGTMP